MKCNSPVSGRILSALWMPRLICWRKNLFRMVSMPGAAGKHGAKRLILKRFPYDVVVKERDGELLVIAIAHHSRRPAYWRDRLST